MRIRQTIATPKGHSMRNIFLVYMPPNNVEAMTHYRETIQQQVPLEKIIGYLTSEQAVRLKKVFGSRPAAVRGSRDSSQKNRNIFDKMTEGDDLLIVEGETIRFMGKIALKTVSAELSKILWKNIDSKNSSGWELIYFIANPAEIDVPFVEFNRLMGYKEAYHIQGLSFVADDRLADFYAKYDDLYSILMRVKRGEAVREKPVSEEIAPAPSTEAEDRAAVLDILKEHQVSDHVDLQWRLAKLGLKAGERVWVPLADQTRIRSAFKFDGFEKEFSAGIDLPKNYFENIDVVWKEEFRINAAFEVENSTSIYSGLLRFADLNAVAPNTTYAMFIVAPADRRNRVREQLRRPAFRRLDLHGKVRFLSYDVVEEIEKFFENSTSGLTVKLIEGKAELIL